MHDLPARQAMPLRKGARRAPRAAAILVVGAILAACTSPTASSPASLTADATSPAVAATGGAPANANATGAGAPGANSGSAPTAGIVPGTPVPPAFLQTAPPTGAASTGAATSIPGTRIEGTVLDADGKPILDASVIIVEGSAPVPAMAVFTDAFGHYQWSVPAGTYTLEASRDGYVARSIEVTVADGETATADFKLEKQ